MSINSLGSGKVRPEARGGGGEDVFGPDLDPYPSWPPWWMYCQDAADKRLLMLERRRLEDAERTIF
jgi:hypothetical protein